MISLQLLQMMALLQMRMALLQVLVLVQMVALLEMVALQLLQMMVALLQIGLARRETGLQMLWLQMAPQRVTQKTTITKLHTCKKHKIIMICLSRAISSSARKPCSCPVLELVVSKRAAVRHRLASS